MRGPKPQPLLNNDPVELSPPSWLSSRQKLTWRKVIASAPSGLLNVMDRGLLCNLVIAIDTHREACEKSRGLGLIVKSPVKGLPMQNPYLPIINKQAQIMIKCAAELGFSPVARARMTKSVGAPARKVLTDEPMGKKAAADAAAKTAQAGTEWETLLTGQPVQ